MLPISLVAFVALLVGLSAIGWVCVRSKERDAAILSVCCTMCLIIGLAAGLAL